MSYEQAVLHCKEWAEPMHYDDDVIDSLVNDYGDAANVSDQLSYLLNTQNWITADYFSLLSEIRDLANEVDRDHKNRAAWEKLLASIDKLSVVPGNDLVETIVPYPRNRDSSSLEDYYENFVLPRFGVSQDIAWQHHVQTNPDNFVHIFTADDQLYALAFDDYPSGFSIRNKPFAEAIKCEGGNEVLAVHDTGDEYSANRTGYFMLFKVTNSQDFYGYLSFLESNFYDSRHGWGAKPENLVMVSRDIVELARVASANHDAPSLYMLGNIVDGFMDADAKDNNLEFTLLRQYIEVLMDKEYGFEEYSAEDLKQVEEEIFEKLADGSNWTIANGKFAAANLGQTVTLVGAMYAKRDDKNTYGASIALLIDDGEVKYPRSHFLDDELRAHFARVTNEERFKINGHNIAQLMPKKLGDYSLVDGSVEMQEIFRRELKYMSW